MKGKQSFFFVVILLLVLAGLAKLYLISSKEVPVDNQNMQQVAELPEKVKDYQAEVQKALSTSKSRMSSEVTTEKLEALMTDLQLTLESFVIDSADQQAHLNLMLEISQIKRLAENDELDNAVQKLEALFSNHLD